MEQEITEYWIEDLKKVLTILKELKGITREEALAQAIGKMVDPNLIEYFTLLNVGEDDVYSTMLMISQRYDIIWLQDFVRQKLKLRTSIGGWRAKQFTSIVTEGKKQEKVWFGFFRKLFRKPKEKEELEDRSLRW